jgi:hypothetical protein
MLLCAFAGTTCGSARPAPLLLLCFPSRRKSLQSISPCRSGSRASDAPAAGTTTAGGAAGSPTTRLYSGRALPPRITTSCKQHYFIIQNASTTDDGCSELKIKSPYDQPQL